jgi:hypothetical protein
MARNPDGTDGGGSVTSVPPLLEATKGAGHVVAQERAGMTGASGSPATMALAAGGRPVGRAGAGARPGVLAVAAPSHRPAPDNGHYRFGIARPGHCSVRRSVIAGNVGTPRICSVTAGTGSTARHRGSAPARPPIVGPFQWQRRLVECG